MAAEEIKRVNDLKTWPGYMERAQVTEPEGKVQFTDEEPEDPREIQKPSDSLMSPSKDAKMM